MSGAAERVNLLGMNRAELEAFVSGFGAKPYCSRTKRVHPSSIDATYGL